MLKEIPIPSTADRVGKAQEVLRVWIVGPQHEMHVSIDVMAFPDSRAWGVAIADLARHIANSYEALAIAPKEKVLGSIAVQFAAEINNPTSEVSVPQQPKPV